MNRSLFVFDKDKFNELCVQTLGWKYTGKIENPENAWEKTLENSWTTHTGTIEFELAFEFNLSYLFDVLNKLADAEHGINYQITKDCITIFDSGKRGNVNLNLIRIVSKFDISQNSKTGLINLLEPLVKTIWELFNYFDLVTDGKLKEK